MINVSEPTIGSVEALLVQDCLSRNQLTQGPMVERFERELARALDVRFAVAVTSGTTALHLVLATLGIGPGDDVLVPNLTFVATSNAVRYCGATPVLVDVDPYTWCIDVEDARRKVTSRTRAIIPVHLYGVPCFMEEVLALANRHNLSVIEDAAEGLGGSYAGHALGTIGLAGTFSFYGNKVITTGEGGAVVTNQKSLAARLRFLRGQAIDPAPSRRYYHPEIGYNYRMTELQAALGVAQVARLPQLLRAREEIFTFYRRELHGRVRMPRVPEGGHQAPWLFTCLVSDPYRVAGQLRLAGIDTRPVFVPLNQLPTYRMHSDAFPASGIVGQHGISLPTHPGLSTSDLHRIVRVFKEALVS